MKILIEKGKVEEVASDILVAFQFAGDKALSEPLRSVDKAMDGYIKDVLEEEGFEAKSGQTLVIHTHGAVKAKRVLIIGVGEKKKLTAETARRAGGQAAKVTAAVQADKATTALDSLTSAKVLPQTAAQAFTEGMLLGSYKFLKYKGKEEKEKAAKAAVKELVIVGKDTTAVRKLKQGAETGQLYSEATATVRDLVNEPAAEVKPKTLAKFAEDIAKAPGVNVRIYSEADIKKLKMGALLAVAAGSDEEPYLIHLSYKPKKKTAKKVVLCGKGITFDTGGLSLKPPEYMEGMKSDMAGAGVVLGVFSKIRELQPDVEVHGVIAATENMPSGKATRPGDIVTAYNGKTIEIANTDAEGRLILADALSWAEDTLKPDYMIDLATLTGSAIVALGQEVAGVMGTDKKLLEAYTKASVEIGEPSWELPLVDEYRQLLKSDVADMQNISKVPWAGTIMGGLFLNNFVEKTPWVHVDIAGPAWVEKPVLSYAPFGGSGFGVRTLMNLLQNLK
ncbi:leucyl aminopeptidase [Patescibacteria group bacterium]